MGTKRRQEILHRVQRTGYVSARDLAEEYGVDTSTVRRDLDALARLGLVVRNHGGASLPAEGVQPTDADDADHLPEKRAIGREVARLIGDGRSVVMDGGSATLEVARALHACRSTTVVTNDLQIATELASQDDVRLIVLGGELLPDRSTLVSDRAVDLVADFQLDYAVLGADAVDARGIAVADTFGAPMKRAMIQAATTVVVVADSSVFERSALVRIADLSDVGVVVTDDGLPDGAAAALDVEVLRVPAHSSAASSPGP
ncbi:DeoR/GlpR family DNA-binding transcription regulator [Cellulomonas sp. ATA003]|uniref:DeoR/GlpR family DNA-binding transcription regulator n=1 Tax=Cellulomonas sp. ATA003 TaxID=3073064 RepID=UPI002873B77D|nr:DeoR/GlpR family DNA-binding transcription regulator [Cellulomonas sp. ATA003]WNB86662.1 DeoR/GlpR family DNA-binding transcription regulator [Cellulomonas sp. ATA003]